ncbi:Uma2 family endonuclease [Nocardiopsis mwathae]|uniref:Uma2 family endonuclease n=2 Tax=Nocardiopsis mwathae TaxID=1472723 RepID=A0A7W9YDA0_9ACTN|nr:Uma2 family endonuclease [Nocardiopsis mwathae]
MTIERPESQERPLTVEDLQRMPDDGRRYELVDGRLDVSPAPTNRHAKVEHRLSWHLQNLAPAECDVYRGAGANFNADRSHHRIPDLSVFRTDDYEEPYFTVPPLLAVEVVSPSSLFRDTNTKRAEYADFGIESYWVINVWGDEPELLEWRLDNKSYRTAAEVVGKKVFETDAPFPVKLVPHWLTAPGEWMDHIGGE